MTDSLSTERAKEEEIVDRVYEALIDQRLAPGTKLSEITMCKAFGVGRMRIRRSLLLLASKNLVELHPNRGAFVAKPTAKQALEIFEARLTLEPSIAKLAAQKSKPNQLKELEKNLLMESAAHASGNRREAIRLSGQFHTSLAKLADNNPMLDMVRDLVTRSSLIIGMFGDAGTMNCRDDEHAGILQALRSGDGALAETLMKSHINHIKEHLDLNKHQSPSEDLISLFSTP